jgi:undecaprenyl-diphosphatase
MGLLQAVVLALIQGITEFLPISSSAHLILVPRFVDWPDQGLVYDVALNSATTLAICVYLRKELFALVKGLVRSVMPTVVRPAREAHETGEKLDGRLAWLLISATVPVAIAGFLAHDIVEGALRNVYVIAATSIFWGIILYMADRRPGTHGLSKVGVFAAIAIGVAQALAIVPGTSRSGITITAGLFLGLTRTASARFSFLLSIPVGIIAGGYDGMKLFEQGFSAPWAAVAVGFIIAFATAYLAIHWFLKLVAKTSMSAFVAYRVALGLFLLIPF